MYRVYQDGKHADCFAYPEVHESWNKSLFVTKREAEVYAFHWAYPCFLEVAEHEAPEMEVGKEYDYGMSEIPVMMKIEEERPKDLCPSCREGTLQVYHEDPVACTIFYRCDKCGTMVQKDVG